MNSIKMTDLIGNDEQMSFSTCDLVLMHLHEALRLGAKMPDFKEYQLFSYILGMCVELLLPLRAAEHLRESN